MNPADMVALARARWPQIEIRCPQPSLAAAELAADVAERLRQAVQQRGRAVLCVSGGRSPVAFFEALRSQPLDWGRVAITLVDERCIPPDHPDSNARLVREHLLQGAVAAARFVPLVDDAFAGDGGALHEPQALARHADDAIAELPVADVLVLGMGADGHTASLFPGSPDLAQALNLATPARVCALRLPEPPPLPAHPRLSWTLAHILRARHIALPVQGADKLATLAAAAGEGAPSGRGALPLNALPICHVLQQTATPVSLWLPS